MITQLVQCNRIVRYQIEKPSRPASMKASLSAHFEDGGQWAKDCDLPGRTGLLGAK